MWSPRGVPIGDGGAMYWGAGNRMGTCMRRVSMMHEYGNLVSAISLQPLHGFELTIRRNVRHNKGNECSKAGDVRSCM